MIMDPLSIIIQNTYSLTSLKNRLSSLNEYLNKNFFGGLEPNNISAEDLLWLNSLPKTFLDSFNRSNSTELFTKLNNDIKALSTLTIYLAFEINSQIEENLGKKAREVFDNPHLLLDIKYDPSLIAGASLVWNGIYRDFSLKARIEEREVVILSSFKKFLH